VGGIPVQAVPARQPHLGPTATRRPAASNEAIVAILVHKSHSNRWYACTRIGGRQFDHKTCSGLQAARIAAPYIYCHRCPQHRQVGGSLSLSPCRFASLGPADPASKVNGRHRPTPRAANSPRKPGEFGRPTLTGYCPGEDRLVAVMEGVPGGGAGGWLPVAGRGSRMRAWERREFCP